VHAIKSIVGGGLGVLLAASSIACSASPPTNAPAATAARSPSVAPPASVAVSGALPDLGLRHVQTDTSAARGARITAAGGTIAATGSNGAVYTLTIPEHALREPTDIGLYPVTSVANMPGSESVAAAAQFAPDGLIFVVPATLTIQLPPGRVSADLGGVAWTGDGQDPHLYPARVEGRTVTLTLFHFSGGGATPNALPLVDPTVCRTPADLESQIQQDVTHPGPGMKAALISHLKRCYRDLVAPALTRSIGVSHGLILDRFLDSWVHAAWVYSDWDLAIVNALSALAPETLADLPEIDQAKALAVSLNRAWFVAYNAKCLAEYAADRADLDAPVQDASLGVDLAFLYADQWHLATRTNRLDLASLLSELCVKVVIDTTYSASNPGDVGTVAVKAGITIGGGPVSAYAMYVRIDAFGTAWDGDAEADGTFTRTVDWPNGLNPIQIRVVGTVVVSSGAIDPPFRSRMIGSSRITRPAERLLFRFNSGLDSWSPGKAGPRGSSNWGSVSNEAGRVRLDGTGHPSAPNAWIFRTINLPQNASTMTFDVSADDAAHADAGFRVRLVAADGTQTDLKVGIARNVHPGHLDFQTITVNIAQWKGQAVTFYFEQNDNGVNGVFTPPGQDEQLYYDNIRIIRA